MNYQQKLKWLELERAKAVYNSRRSLLAFTCYTKPDYQVAWHNQLLASKLDAWVRGEIKNLMIFMPPRHGKSELVSRRLPAYLHGLYPDEEIMAVSYLDNLASEMCTAAQKIMDSPEYADVFPGTKILDPRRPYTEGIRNSLAHTIVGRKGRYMSAGVGGSFTGKGANRILIDDPIKGREIADSEAFRERLWQMWLNDLKTRLETNLQTGKRGQCLMTLTRWHEDDLAGRCIDLMRKDPKAMQWEILKLPAVREDLDDPNDKRAVGEALWPQKYNLQDLEEIKAGLKHEIRAWSSVYQQTPVPGDGNYFKEHMFKFVDPPAQFHWVFCTADTAYKEKEQNDFTVFSVWGVNGEELFLIDVFRKQIRSSDIELLVEPFLKRHISYGYRATLIEPKGHGIYLNQKWATKGLMIPSELDLTEFYKDRHLDKCERANNAIPQLAYRTVYISNHIAEGESLIAEALGFPNTKHDDWVDTLIDAIKRVYSHTPSILDTL